MSQIQIVDLHSTVCDPLSFNEQEQIDGGYGTFYNDVPSFEVEEIVTLPNGITHIKVKLLLPRPNPQPSPPIGF